VTVSPQRNRIGLYFVLLPDKTGAKAGDAIAFLHLLRRHLGNKLTIYWDRGRIHDHSLVVRQWLAKQKDIRTERFPPYAPELNPDEYVWSYAKYAKLWCNYAAPSLAELRERISGELTHLAKNKALPQSFIGHINLTKNKRNLFYESRNQ
jgi:transposase